MIRRLGIGLLVLGLILAILPWYAGRQAQAHYEELLTRLEKQGLRVVERHYEAGWLSSQAVTHLEWPLEVQPEPRLLAPDLATPPARLEATSHIEHGPLVWQGQGSSIVEPLWARIHTQLSLRADDADQVTDPEKTPPVRVDTRVALDGKVNSQLTMDDSRTRERVIQGVKGSLLLWDKGERQDGQLTIGLLEFREGGAAILRFDNLRLDLEGRPDPSGLSMGELNLSLERLGLDGDTPGSLNGLQLTFRSQAQGDQVEFSADYRVRALTQGDVQLAPMELRIRLSGLSAPVLKDLQQRMAEENDEQSPPTPDAYLADLWRLLGGNPKLALERLHLATPEGSLDAHFSLDVKDLPKDGAQDLGQLLTHLVGEAEVSVAEPLLHRILDMGVGDTTASPPDDPARQEAPSSDTQNATNAPLLEGWLRQELAVREGGRILTRVRLSGGLLTVNGKIIPVPLLGGLARD